MHRRVVLCCVLFILPLAARAQAAPAKDPLFVAIAEQDKALVDAYNTCDLKTLGAVAAEDLEFYHDKTGLAVVRATVLDSIQKNICGKVTRELVTTSLEVHPLAGYGAVEIGTHRFHHPGEQEHDVLGEAKFVMLWQQGWCLEALAGDQL